MISICGYGATFVFAWLAMGCIDSKKIQHYFRVFIAVITKQVVTSAISSDGLVPAAAAAADVLRTPERVVET